jgi:hypothetical protein
MVKTYTKKQFIEDVKKEAMALKEHATREELGKLDFTILNPNSGHLCVYGQLTGMCDSDRADELIKECAPRLYVHLDDFVAVPTNNFENFYWSPIEKYILDDDAKNKNLIDYLKGNRNDLVL